MKKYLKIISRLLFIQVLVGAAFLSILAGQDQHTPTVPDQVIRVQVETVPVSVTVLDGKGYPVLGLKPGDFEISVDGKRVDLLNFSWVSSRRENTSCSDPAYKAAAPDKAASPQADLSSAQPRTMIILLGRGRRYFDASEAISDWVRENASPQDRLAVLMFNRLSELTADHDKILRFLDHYKDSHVKIEQELARRASNPAGVRELLETMSRCRVTGRVAEWVVETFGQAGLKPQRIIPSIHLRPRAEGGDYEVQRGSFGLQSDVDSSELQRSQAARQSGTAAGSTDRLEMESQEQLARSGLPGPVFDLRRRMAMMDTCGLSAAIEHMRFLGGEKSIIYFNAGGLMMETESDSKMIRSASSARVRIFAVQNEGFGFHFGQEAILTGNVNPRGLMNGREFLKTTPHIFSGRTDQVLALEALEEMAEGSGGKAFLTKSPDDALREVQTLTDSYYLLGIAPVGDPDGQFRKVEVKVKGAHADVRHRNGFYAQAPPTPEELKTQLVRSRMFNAAYHPDLLTDLPFEFRLLIGGGGKEADASPHQGSSDDAEAVGQHFDKTRLTFSMDPPQSLFSRAAGRGSGKLASAELVIGYFVLSPETERAWSSFDRVQLELDPRQLERLRREGFHLEKALDIPDEFTQGVFKIVVYDPESDRLGSAVTAFERN